MPSLRLSLCMIVRDEAATLARCLDSVRGLADEIIVVDTGSTDDSPAIARGFGADVIAVPWSDDFSAARNAGLARARGAWILVLDGDEWLPPESVEALRTLIARPPVEAFHLIQCSLDPTAVIVNAAAVRLFPNRPDVRYRFPIHEEVNASLRQAGIALGGVPIKLFHTGYASRAMVERKFERNRRISAAALARGATPDEELHLRFYRACLHFDERAWREAAEDFEWCAACDPTATVGRAAAARLRAAECCYELGEDVRAAELLPPAPDAGLHPQALVLGARLALRRGAAEEAGRWYRALATIVDGTFAPPVALAPLQREAAAFLANA